MYVENSQKDAFCVKSDNLKDKKRILFCSTISRLKFIFFFPLILLLPKWQRNKKNILSNTHILQSVCVNRLTDGQNRTNL
jgi:hypothetical protein